MKQEQPQMRADWSRQTALLCILPDLRPLQIHLAEVHLSSKPPMLLGSLLRCYLLAAFNEGPGRHHNQARLELCKD